MWAGICIAVITNRLFLYVDCLHSLFLHRSCSLNFVFCIVAMLCVFVVIIFFNSSSWAFNCVFDEQKRNKCMTNTYFYKLINFSTPTTANSRSFFKQLCAVRRCRCKWCSVMRDKITGNIQTAAGSIWNICWLGVLCMHGDGLCVGWRWRDRAFAPHYPPAACDARYTLELQLCEQHCDNLRSGASHSDRKTANTTEPTTIGQIPVDQADQSERRRTQSNVHLHTEAFEFLRPPLFAAGPQRIQRQCHVRHNLRW